MTGVAAAAPAANRNARRADHGDDGATEAEGAGQKVHIQKTTVRKEERLKE